MLAVQWEAEAYRIRYHWLCLERFDLQKKLNKLKIFYKFPFVTSEARRRERDAQRR
jgi:hypothetical protein